MKVATRAIILAAAVAAVGATTTSQAAADDPTAWFVECHPSPAIFPVTVSNSQDLGAVLKLCAVFGGVPRLTVVK